MRHQTRQYIHQWICIRDIVDGLITCNHTLKSKNIMEILSKMETWIKQRNQPKTIQLKATHFDLNINAKLFKAKARQLVWDLMEMKYRYQIREREKKNVYEKIFVFRNEVRFPRPAHGRVPNFRYCEIAAENVTSLECFKRARVIKINPSLAQEPIRYLTLAYNKVLLTPTPSLGKRKTYSHV